MELFNKFVEGVKDGSILSCEEIILSVDRHLSDLEKSKDKDYPYYFNEDIAKWSLDVLGSIRHTADSSHSSAGEFFRITPMQAFITCQIFGWVKKSNDKRRFKKLYLEVPRKWGKSEFLAALSIIFGYFDGEEGAQIITAATKLPQCKYVFEPIKVMIRKLIKDFPELDNEIIVNDRLIKVPSLNNKFFCLSADAAKEDGANPHFAAVDELHAHVNGALLKVIETGTMSKSQSLVAMITTAGFNRFSLCYQQRTVVQNILDGVVENDRYLGIITKLDKDDDWRDSKLWIKANPHIGVTVSMENMEDALQKALTEGPDAEIEFRTKNLNEWCDAPTHWINKEDWRNCGDPKLKLSDYKGKKIVCGLDLSKTSDLTALCIIVIPQDGIENPIYFFRFYGPSTKIQTMKRSDGVDYKSWVKQGHINMTPGNTIDYGYIKNDILEIAEKNKLTLLEYDKFNSYDLVAKLTDEGIECNHHSQTPQYMNMPVKRLFKLVQNHPNNVKNLDEDLKQYLSTENKKEGETEDYMIHDNNPVMEWMMSNVEILTDSNGNEKISKNSVKGGGKKQANNKVDGPVAMAMATTAYLFPPESNESTYNSKELFVIG